MELATSKQLWKLNDLANKRFDLITVAQLYGNPPVDEIMTDIPMPLSKKAASGLIANLIQNVDLLEQWVAAHRPVTPAVAN